MQVIFNHTSALCLQKATIIKTLFSRNQHHLFRNLVNQTVLDYSYNTSLSLQRMKAALQRCEGCSLFIWKSPFFCNLKEMKRKGENEVLNLGNTNLYKFPQNRQIRLIFNYETVIFWGGGGEGGAESSCH